MAVVTPKQMLKHSKALLGPEAGELFHHCRQELWNVVSTWDQYEALFSTSGRIELLNRSAGSFWGETQGLMFEATLLGVTRLTDPPKDRRGNTNVSIRAVQEFVPQLGFKRFHFRVDRAVKLSEFARDWRHKRIAHRDLQTATGARTLSKASRARVSRALVAIDESLAWIEDTYLEGSVQLEPLSVGHALEVLYALADHLSCRDKKYEDMVGRPRDNVQNWRQVIQQVDADSGPDYARFYHYRRPKGRRTPFPSSPRHPRA